MFLYSITLTFFFFVFCFRLTYFGMLKICLRGIFSPALHLYCIFPFCPSYFPFFRVSCVCRRQCVMLEVCICCVPFYFTFCLPLFFFCALLLKFINFLVNTFWSQKVNATTLKFTSYAYISKRRIDAASGEWDGLFFLHKTYNNR